MAEKYVKLADIIDTLENEWLCMRAQWEIRRLVGAMVDAVDEELRWMLVPKCRSGRIACAKPCGKVGE